MINYKLIHSLSTERSISNENNIKLYIHICYFFLSCLYAKINGFNIILHTDEFGKELLKNALYDDIIIDIKKPKNISDKFFAWPKFIALANSPKDAIHIDGDVMLKNPHIKNLLWNNHDVICQCEENKLINTTYGTVYNISAESFKNCKYPIWANRECNIMYNTGVIGIFNKKLKQEWIDTYWTMTNEYNINGNYIKYSYPDIIIEQQFLRDLIIYKNYLCNFIITEKHDFNKMNDEAIQKGYFHAMNDKQNLLQICIKRIIEINPLFEQELYRIKNILNI